MGYKTFLTFPAQRPLDGRINLILTKKKALSVKGAEICHSVEEALVRIDELKQEKHLTDVEFVIIGGESVYRSSFRSATQRRSPGLIFPMWQTHTWLIWRKKAGNW